MRPEHELGFAAWRPCVACGTNTPRQCNGCDGAIHYTCARDMQQLILPKEETMYYCCPDCLEID